MENSKQMEWDQSLRLSEMLGIPHFTHLSCH